MVGHIVPENSGKVQIKYDLLANRSDADFIKSIALGSIAKFKLPTDKQVNKFKKIVNEATEKGYIMND